MWPVYLYTYFLLYEKSSLYIGTYGETVIASLQYNKASIAKKTQ